MNITTILGSPRKNGNTSAVLGWFEELAAQQHTITHIDILRYDLHGCKGCDVCQEQLDEPGCLEEDDFLDILRLIDAADLVVYASPVYVWSFPAQMKALIDRHYCTVKWLDGEKAACLLQGKRVALLLTCGGSEAENADLVRVEFQRQIDYIGGQLLGVYVVENCPSPKETRKARWGLEVARRMALDLC